MHRKIKILYWVSDANHERIFSMFKEDDRFIQAMGMHNHISEENLHIEEIYKYRKISNGIVKIIDEFKPDVFIQADGHKVARKFLKKRKVKHVYLNHGMWAKSPNNLFRAKDEFWQEFDIFCGLTDNMKTILKRAKHTRIPKNTMIQFDTLYEIEKNSAQHRKDILQRVNPDATKIIMMFGHETTNRESLNPSHEEYYTSAVRLAELAQKNNWILCIKPKGSNSIEYLCSLATQQWAWAAELVDKYEVLKANPNVLMLHEAEDQYKFICGSDVIVSSARSTVEIEAILVDKPLVRLCAERNDTTEPFEHGILDAGVAYVAKNTDDVEKMITLSLEGELEFVDNRKAFIKSLGIKFDGKAVQRTFSSIIEMMEEYQLRRPQREIQSEIWAGYGRDVHDTYMREKNIRGEKLSSYFSKHRFATVLEIGCSSGKNLHYIAKHHKHIRLFGIEINQIAVTEARKNVRRATIRKADIHKINPTKKYDVVFTGGLLMHLPPDDVESVIKKCIQGASKYVIHMESIGENVIHNGPEEFYPEKIRAVLKCSHDIVGIYERLGYAGNIEVLYGAKDSEPFIVVKVG